MAGLESRLGVAVSFTDVPWSKLALVSLQVAPQLIPAGTLVTVPDPAPDLVVASWWSSRVKWALTSFTEDMETKQSSVPLQPAPLQPSNSDPAAEVALSVTD